MRWLLFAMLPLAGCVDDYPDHLPIVLAEHSLVPSPGASASIDYGFEILTDYCKEGVTPHYEGNRLHLDAHTPLSKVWVVSQYQPSDYPQIGHDDASTEPAEPVLLPNGLDPGDGQFRMRGTYNRSVQFAYFTVDGTTVHIDGQRMRDGDTKTYQVEYGVENGTIQETVRFVMHARHPVKLHPDPCY